MITDDINKTAVSDRNRQMFLMILDIDNFKSVNDSYGHYFGDEVIKAFADSLKLSVGGRGIVGRIGGDEFVMLIENPVEAEIQSMIESVSAALQEKNSQGEMPVSSAVGWAEGCGVDVRKIINEADTKMYENKTRGKECRK